MTTDLRPTGRTLHGRLGLRALFHGHGGLLAPGAASIRLTPRIIRLSISFGSGMATSGNLREYHAKTRENIQQLFHWVEAIERALPVERSGAFGLRERKT